MAEKTATQSALTIDRDEYQIRQIVNRIFYLIQPYVAHANEREVMELLYKFYTEGDLTLIHKQQLKIYQELEKLMIDRSLTAPNNGLIPNG